LVFDNTEFCRSVQFGIMEVSVMTETRVGKDETLLTEREAAARLGYSVYSLREFRKRGLIDHFKFNSRTIKYSLTHLEAFMREHLQVRHA
jgi:hypothetical protein